MPSGTYLALNAAVVRQSAIAGVTVMSDGLRQTVETTFRANKWVALVEYEGDQDGAIHYEVDTSIADSWDSAVHEPNTDIEWTVEDDDSSDDDYVSVSRELFSTLLVKARGYDAHIATCTCVQGS